MILVRVKEKKTHNSCHIDNLVHCALHAFPKNDAHHLHTVSQKLRTDTIHDPLHNFQKKVLHLLRSLLPSGEQDFFAICFYLRSETCVLVASPSNSPQQCVAPPPRSLPRSAPRSDIRARAPRRSDPLCTRKCAPGESQMGGTGTRACQLLRAFSGTHLGNAHFGSV